MPRSCATSLTLICLFQAVMLDVVLFDKIKILSIVQIIHCIEKTIRLTSSYKHFLTFLVTVNCSDDGHRRLSIASDFHITINDVNEAPVNIILNGSHEVDEIAHFNYSLGDLICIDPDQNQTCSFQVLGEYNDTFYVSAHNS